MRKFIIICASLLFSLKAYAVNRIDITKGNIEPFPIAINDFLGVGEETKTYGGKIADKIKSDLEGSGLFKVIDRRSFIEKIKSVDYVPNFISWRQINASAVLVGSVVPDGDNLKVNFRLWDSFTQTQSAGKVYIGTRENWRKIAHKIADDIYSELTGEGGYFNSKIVYVAEKGPSKQRERRLAIMDQDGDNHHYLSYGKAIVMTPRFSPDATKILYLSYASKKPRVYIKDLKSGSEHIIGEFSGMSFAPRFSPDGKEAVMSIAKNGATNIYLINLASSKMTKITDGSWIDTAPFFSPDGQKIVFESDRSCGCSRTQLYIMNKDGSDVARISFGDGGYHTPTWSPRGDFIAFTKINKGNFHIGVIRPDGSGERILTEGYVVEGPSWSPNGRVIMFFKGEAGRGAIAGKTKINSVDVTGYHQREIITPQDASDPNWSPLLK